VLKRSPLRQDGAATPTGCAHGVFEAEKIKRPERWVRALLPGLPDFEQSAARE
jgi:hypothetical protein